MLLVSLQKSVRPCFPGVHCGPSVLYSVHPPVRLTCICLAADGPVGYTGTATSNQDLRRLPASTTGCAPNAGYFH